MGLSVLVTRPEPEATATAADLERLGHRVLKAPMLQLEYLTPKLPEGGFAATVATSQNGMRGLVRLAGAERLRALPLYTVGDATAAAARDLGFADVRSAGGAFVDLVDLLRRQPLGPCTLLYACGQQRSADLAAALAPEGIDVTMIEVYRMGTARMLAGDVAAALGDGRVDCILIYSERTAAALSQVLKVAGVLEAAATVPAIAISERAAGPLIAAGFKAVKVASKPTSEALLSALDQMEG